MTQEELFIMESRDSDLDGVREPKRKGHGSGYGYIEIENPNFLEEIYTKNGVTYYDERKYLLRKPTVEERREIVINTIIERGDKGIKVAELAKLLGISERTLQMVLKRLKEEGLIEVCTHFADNGVQLHNTYRYVGKPCEFYGSGLTLKMLHSSDEDYGFRFWDWRNYYYAHNKVWHTNYSLLKNKACSHIKRRRYLEKHGLPLIAPKGIKYLTIYYSYWLDDDKRDATKEPLSQDGVMKISLDTNGGVMARSFGGIKLLFYILGSNDNPKVKIFNLEAGEVVNTFTWFSSNEISIERHISPNQSDKLRLFGDFTTK